MSTGAVDDDPLVAPFIDGVMSKSTGNDCVEVINPSNGKHLFSIPAGSETDVNRAVISARNAFEDGRWCEAPPSFRKSTLLRFAEKIATESHTLDMLDAEEMGKPVSEPRFSAAFAAMRTRFFAEAIDKVMGDVFGSDQHSLIVQRRVPQGVVAAVTPWNFPTVNAVIKIAPALAAGNCVVLKPSELSSRSALRLAQLALHAGLPPGVLNVVPGRGETVGRALALHEDVDMLTFTGSTEVGKLMMQYAGQSNLKRVIAECGGKSPHIVFADGIDLDAAGDSIARMLLTNQGQICSVGSRLLVQRSIEKQLVDRILAQFGRIVMGDALNPKTTFGPVASAKQCERVMRYIAAAQAEGAERVSGGHKALPDSGGYFVEPTLFRNVSPDAVIAQEEIFGPVLSVITFEDTAEAIRIANSTRYGLAAYVWTTDLSVGLGMAKGIRSTIFINAATTPGEGAGLATSSEPFGESGIGVESGLAGLESYLRRQLIAIHHA